MKSLLVLILVLRGLSATAQEIDSVFVNLYTDSLKKGTYNYINVDGVMKGGRYLPLDSTHIIFKSSHGKFHGNNLWIDKNLQVAKVDIQIIWRKDNRIIKNLEMYIKIKEEEALKTEQQLLDEMKEQRKNKKQKT